MRMVIAITAIAFPAMAVSNELKPFEGVWAVAEEVCLYSDESRYKVLITENVYERRGLQCKVSAISGAARMWKLRLDCKTEEGRDNYWVKLINIEKDKLILERSWEPSSNIYVRCHHETDKTLAGKVDKKKPEGMLIRGELKYGPLDSFIGDYAFLTNSQTGRAIFRECIKGKECEIRAKVKGHWIERLYSVEDASNGVS